MLGCIRIRFPENRERLWQLALLRDENPCL
jgi:hypothetical protein